MMKRQKKLVFVFIGSLFSLLLVACTANHTKNGEQLVQDPNIQTIESVLQQLLNAPDEELLTEYYYLTNTFDEKPEMTSSATDKLNNLLDERFGDFFTTTGYEKFIDELAFKYSIAAESSEYQLMVNGIDVTQDKNDSHHYVFKVHLVYITDDGEEKTALVTGKAESQEKGKLSSIEIKDDEGIEQEMIENSQ